MTEQTPKKLSRRDALKILGAAAGASALANLPLKWKTPDLADGVLPAHAQTSCLDNLFIEVLSADGCLVYKDSIGPEPYAFDGDGSTGSTALWYCQNGCLQILFSLADITSQNPSAVVQVTTLTDTFTLNIGLQSPQSILVELDSGEYDVNDTNGSAGSCGWLLFKDGNASRWFGN